MADFMKACLLLLWEIRNTVIERLICHAVFQISKGVILVDLAITIVHPSTDQIECPKSRTARNSAKWGEREPFNFAWFVAGLGTTDKLKWVFELVCTQTYGHMHDQHYQFRPFARISQLKPIYALFLVASK